LAAEPSPKFYFSTAHLDAIAEKCFPQFVNPWRCSKGLGNKIYVNGIRKKNLGNRWKPFSWRAHG
jgi:hypothetical protein